ncbi:THAP domain-containing protein 2 [Formica fusca]
MVHCQACGITTKARNYGITFHRFPKNEDQRCAWINFVKEKKGLQENDKCTALCSQHFETSCFDRTSPEKVRLKQFSVPTIYISRLKYERIHTTVAAMTEHLQTESINETSLIDTVAFNNRCRNNGLYFQYGYF